ncbi:HEPN domain-containing protein [Candidatus Amarolinea aalborgensis]|jgi:HEPN domain-containing protein|uniref:HEPN domain-containing protein n=1 Tax=Candidatus Amarolinea aalborgensis TaxID=2249329 RepID=UPI003BFA2302
MKPITDEWLTRAAEDLSASQVLLFRPDLTNAVTFHAQQAVEKALKAVIEELDLGFVKTHSLTRLYELVRPHYAVIGDLDMLDRLDAVYIDARYPGDMGLLPTGKPTSDEAIELYSFANDICQRLQASLQDTTATSSAGHDKV